MFSIRSFDANSDYPGITAVWNAAWPDLPRSVRRWQQEDAMRPPGLVFERLVVEIDDTIMAFGELMQAVEPEMSARYWAMLEMQPAYARMNIGTALYSRLLGALQRLGAERVVTRVRADQLDRIHFLETRGFQQTCERATSVPAALISYGSYGQKQESMGKPQWVQFEKPLSIVQPYGN